MSKGFTTATAGLLVARDVGLCVCCGLPAREKHHRRRRRVNHDGLAHSPANGILLCGWGNHTGCHGQVHTYPRWAREHGYIVLPEESPLEVSLQHFSRGRILLDEEGGWTAAKNGEI